MPAPYLVSSYRLYNCDSKSIISLEEYGYKHYDFAKIIDAIENSVI